MSILPEYILQQVLVRGVRAFREDHTLVQMLFRNLHQDDVMGLVEFLRDHTIDIVLNYPEEPVTVPAIVITLKNESESQGFLGDSLQPPKSVQATGHPFPMEDVEDPADVLGGGSVTDVGLSDQPLESPIQALGASATALTFSAQSPFKISDPFEVDNLQIRILQGTGAGQVRQVVSIAPNRVAGTVVVEVDTAWTTPPDSTSIFSFFTRDPYGVQGEPSKLYDKSSVVERIGAHYRVSYQLLIGGPNSEITLFLYAIVKAIMFINYTYLQKSGFLNLKMSGTDFVAKPEYFPDRAFARALIMEFEHSFDVYLEVEAVNKIRMDIAVYDPNVGDGSGMERVVSTVEFDL